MRGFAALVTVLAVAAPARAELAPRTEPMMTVDEPVCSLLNAAKGDHCKRVASAGDAALYRSGSPTGIRRFVVAIPHGDATLVSPALDVAADLGDAAPTIRAIQIDGRAGLVVDVITTHDEQRDETIVGCGTTTTGTWKCETVDVGECSATIDDSGALATSCGGHVTLSIR
jgi:hypothetical protein